jgi:hypothetical protein
MFRVAFRPEQTHDPVAAQRPAGCQGQQSEQRQPAALRGPAGDGRTGPLQHRAAQERSVVPVTMAYCRTDLQRDNVERLQLDRPNSETATERRSDGTTGSGTQDGAAPARRAMTVSASREVRSCCRGCPPAGARAGTTTRRLWPRSALHPAYQMIERADPSS